MYDPARDNRFPHAYDPEYWVKALQFYVRKYKYDIETFFQPWEVQIVTVLMSQESLIRDEDIVYTIRALIVLGIIFLISLYEKNVNGRTQGDTKNEVDDLSE